MDPITLGLIAGGSSLIGDLISQSTAVKNAKSAKQKAIDAYKKLLIPYSESKQRADKAGDTVYTKAMNEINSGAFQYAGALNSDVLSALAVSKMISAKQITEQQVLEDDTKYNREIMNRVAQAEAIPEPTIDIGKSILTGLEEGVGGYLSGKQLEMAEGLNKALLDYYNKMGTTSQNNTATNNSDVVDQLAKVKKKKKYLTPGINDYDLSTLGTTRFSKFF